MRPLASLLDCLLPAEFRAAAPADYLCNFRNPDSDHPQNNVSKLHVVILCRFVALSVSLTRKVSPFQGPPEPLHAPAFVGEYRFRARKEPDGAWRFCFFEEQHHFARESLPVRGRNQGPSSSIPDSDLRPSRL